MEVIIAFLLIVLSGIILNYIFTAFGAAGKAAIGKGSFSENMNSSLYKLGRFEIQFHDTHVNNDGTGVLVKEVLGRGLFPVRATKNIGFIISLFDVTDKEIRPVITPIALFQEYGSVVFQNTILVGKIDPNQGFTSWRKIAVIIPDIIVPPISGLRNLVVVVRMVDMDNCPTIAYDFNADNDPGILWQGTLAFDYLFKDKGYLEALEHREEAVGLSLKIGMAVAMSDGALDDAEGEVLKQWIVKSIAPFSKEKQESLKKIYNDAMREAYAEANDGNLSLSNLTERLKKIGDKPSKYETMELCFEVMSADGVANVEELKLIRKIADTFGLDMDEIDKMRDQNIVGLNSNVAAHASIETMLGIEPDWSNERIKKHLRDEFNKWNNRLNTLPEGEERKNAQLMIDRIAEARTNYAKQPS